ncbi:type VII secretion integral membrane protein EccD [Solicola gregarius]|uniref:Type VII secretion integral membrane protein EccD n=1 Tax=Solicola gregarius TaxID=2908642 RepID=A0AA46TGY1_9ACTN|nr:type VII secretion integral membrane protein EccD [Solicola gregarius]UYM04941.1 type VII secretion integral membrane protein EccD [Solicola gregarius]
MLTAYSRVTVVSPERTVDLALPSALPLSEVVPQVLRFCSPNTERDQPTAWTLARVGGTPIPLGQTLSDAGVLDGEVLELRGQRANVKPAVVEDVRDAVEDSTDEAGGVWSPTTTVTYALLAAAALFTAVGLLQLATPWMVTGDDAVEITSGFVVVATLLGATAWATQVSHPWVEQICLAVAMGWGYLVGSSLATTSDLDPAWGWMIGFSCAAAVAGGGRILTPSGIAHVSWSVFVLVAAVTAGVLTLITSIDIPPLQDVRSLPVVFLLVVGILPRVSLSVGGLASADYRVRNAAAVTSEQLRARYRESNGLLIGALIGIATVVVWAGWYLQQSDLWWDRYLVISIGLVAILRSRVFSRIQHLVPLRVAGTIVLVLEFVAFSQEYDAMQTLARHDSRCRRGRPGRRELAGHVGRDPGAHQTDIERCGVPDRRRDDRDDVRRDGRLREGRRDGVNTR